MPCINCSMITSKRCTHTNNRKRRTIVLGTLIKESVSVPDKNWKRQLRRGGAIQIIMAAQSTCERKINDAPREFGMRITPSASLPLLFPPFVSLPTSIRVRTSTWSSARVVGYFWAYFKSFKLEVQWMY